MGGVPRALETIRQKAAPAGSNSSLLSYKPRKGTRKLWEGVKTEGAQVLSTQRSQSVQNVQALFTKTRGHKDGPAFIKDEEKIRHSSKGSERVYSSKGRPYIQMWKTRHTLLKLSHIANRRISFIKRTFSC